MHTLYSHAKETYSYPTNTSVAATSQKQTTGGAHTTDAKCHSTAEAKSSSGTEAKCSNIAEAEYISGTETQKPSVAVLQMPAYRWHKGSRG